MSGPVVSKDTIDMLRRMEERDARPAPTSALRTLRRAHDRLVICAETSEDWTLVREMDVAIEQVAVMQASADVSLAELIASTSIYTGRMPHPVCQSDED